MSAERPVAALAYSETLVRQALVRVVENAGLIVQYQADSTHSLVNAVRQGCEPPDLIIVEAGLPELTPAVLQELAKRFRVAVLTSLGMTEDTAQFLRAGAVGSLSLNMEEAHFAEALRLLVQGDVVISGDLASGISHLGLHPGEPDQKGEHLLLSDREKETLSLIATGATNKEIATQLIVTEHTVKVHLRHILEKLNLRNRQQAAVYAVQNGILVQLPEQEDRAAS